MDIGIALPATAGTSSPTRGTPRAWAWSRCGTATT